MRTKAILFSVMGLRVTLVAMALVAFGGLAVVLMIVWLVFGAPLVEAVAGGLIAALLHYVMGFLHHIGHAIAARRTGYPMTGIHYWGPLATSVYPKDEPPLPGSTHIQRALGGPIFSALVSVGLAVLVLLTRPPDNLIDWLIIFALIDNFLVFTLGVLVPARSLLGIETDMDTIMKWRAKG